MLNQPFFQVALPIMGTIIVAVWAQVSTNNRRLDDLMRRMDRLENRVDTGFDEVKNRLMAIATKVETLELKAWR